MNSKSFRNYQQGVRLHLNKNLVFKGLLLADNGIGVSSFDNTNEIVFDDVTVIGLTAKAREFSAAMDTVISSGLERETGICRFCHHSISGVKFASDPSHTQLSLRNVSFRGFEPHSALDHTPISAILPGVAVATQSSTCWGRPASMAINGDHGDFSHTCAGDSPAWWMVDFGEDTAVGEGMFII